MVGGVVVGGVVVVVTGGAVVVVSGGAVLVVGGSVPCLIRVVVVAPRCRMDGRSSPPPQEESMTQRTNVRQMAAGRIGTF